MGAHRETSCRRCRVYCDWVIDPLACLGCDRLYAYDAEDGRRYAGCVDGVHAAEIDLAALEACVAEERPFGAVRAVRMPLPACAAAVDAAYPQRLPAIGCVHPEFAEPPGGGAFTVTARGDAPARDGS